MEKFRFDPNIVRHTDYKNVEVVETKHFDTCPECKGAGELPLPWNPDLNYRCKACNGSGTIDPEKQTEDKYMQRMKSIRERIS